MNLTEAAFGTAVDDEPPDLAGLPPLGNVLEPPGLLRAFLTHPPRDFAAFITCTGAPAFRARFDLLTTADAATRRRIGRLPLYARWKDTLRPRTCFVGTTVSEYAPLPRGRDAAAAVAALLQAHAPAQPFLVVKDIPQDSPLLDAADNRRAADFAEACAAAGCVLVAGQALAYVPIDFADADAYLARLSHARRRDIRRKLRARAALQIEALPTGADCFRDARVLEHYYALYLAVYRQSELHFDLLTPAFFQAVLQDAGSGGVVFAYRRAGELIGWNLCYAHAGMLIDKYIGFAYPQARAHNLYAVSWMQNIEYARARGLRHYVAGWTDPEVKAALGARFTFTRHAVYARSRVLRALLRRCAGRFERDRAWFEGRAGAHAAGP